MAGNRIDILRSLVTQNPTDSRTRYMLAMELANSGELEAAVAEYESILKADADYAAAYYHGGQALEKLGREDDAGALYRRGIEACERTGNDHTRSELQEALDALG